MLYEELDLQKYEFRLMRFIDNGSEGQGSEPTLALELQRKSRDHDIHYAALSYTWGDMQDVVEILVNGHPFPIGRNLYYCLRELQAQSVGSWLWADGICINQSDMEEKQAQVRVMDEIYGNAKLVYSWLGLGSKATDQAMAWIAKIGSRAPNVHSRDIWHQDVPNDEIRDYLKARSPRRLDEHDLPGASEFACLLYDMLNDEQARARDVVEGIRDILQRDYWHRIWIIQEIALAQEISIMCGQKSVLFNDFDRAFCAIRYCVNNDLYRVHQEYRSNQIIPGISYDIKSITMRRQRTSEQDIFIQDILFDPSSVLDRPHYSASDPRDFAFGLMGVLNSESRGMLTVDYGQTVEQVFTILTRAMLAEPIGFFKLDWCVPKEAETAMPSWVPDWREVGKRGVQVYSISYSTGRVFDAMLGGEVPRPIELDGNGDASVLHLEGHFVDVITDVMKPPEWVKSGVLGGSRRAETESWLSSIREFAGLWTESGPSEDYVWRTVLRDYTLLFPSFRREFVTEEVAQLIRQLFRREQVQADTLTESQLNFIRGGTHPPGIMAELGSLEKQLQFVERYFVSDIGVTNRRRTLFKTKKTMLGLGHVSLQVGDVVTLIKGMKTPIILRKRGIGTGFVFAGDAYVDGIMYGEFLQTNPAPQEFHVY
jgi:hypothetical protein